MQNRLFNLLLEALSREAKSLLQYKRSRRKLNKRQKELEPLVLKGDRRDGKELGDILKSKVGNKKGIKSAKEQLLRKLHREGKRDLKGKKLNA